MVEHREESPRQDVTPVTGNRWKRWLPALVPLAVLLLLEAIVRLTLPYKPLLEMLVQAPQQLAGFADREKVQIVEGDPLLFWRLKPNLHDVVWDFTWLSTNAQGFRDPRPLGPKPANGWRVVCVGDSVTFGYRVPLVWPRRPELHGHERPFPRILEAELQKQMPHFAVDAVTMAVPGYSSYQGRLWVERDLASMHPNVVIICFGWNDASLRRFPDAEVMRPTALRLLVRGMMEWSQAVTYGVLAMRRLTGARAPDSSETCNRVDPASFVDNCLAMAAVARSCGARPIFVAPIYRDRTSNPAEADRIRALRDALRGVAAPNGIQWVEIDDLTEKGQEANRRLFGEAIHLSDAGHRLLARVLLPLAVLRTSP